MAQLALWALVNLHVELKKLRKEQKRMANRVEDFKTEVLAEVAEANASLDKISAETAELLAKVAELAALLEASQNLSAEEQAALDEVKAAASALADKAKGIDDQVADPAPEPPVEG